MEPSDYTCKDVVRLFKYFENQAVTNQHESLWCGRWEVFECLGDAPIPEGAFEGFPVLRALVKGEYDFVLRTFEDPCKHQW